MSVTMAAGKAKWQLWDGNCWVDCPGDATDGAKIQGTVEVSNLPATQPVSGTVAVSSAPTTAVTGPVTDAQLRASAVPVSGTFYQATQPVSGPLTDAQLRANAVAVSGSFYPVTQPVSLAAAPTTAVTGTFWQATQPVSGPLTDAQLRASAVPVSGTFYPATQPVSGTITANAGSGPFPVSDNGGSLTVDAPVGTPTFVRTSDGSAAIDPRNVVDGTDATKKAKVSTAGNVSVDGTNPSFPSKSIGASGSLGTTTAAIFAEKAVWVVPASYTFRPIVARCGVTTAASRTIIAAGARLGTWNPGTNTFVADQSVSAPDFYDRLFYRVNVTHSATATNVTATYTDQDGNGGATTTANVIPASAAGGNWWEFTLATGDVGVRAVTGVSDTANPTSVVDEIWGLRTLLEDLGPANTLSTVSFAEIAASCVAGETVFVLMHGAATTAQQRHASVMGVLVPV